VKQNSKTKYGEIKSNQNRNRWKTLWNKHRVSHSALATRFLIDIGEK
jgi:hypothetical protein